jgi:hypothetical protein
MSIHGQNPIPRKRQWSPARRHPDRTIPADLPGIARRERLREGALLAISDICADLDEAFTAAARQRRFMLRRNVSLSQRGTDAIFL